MEGERDLPLSEQLDGVGHGRGEGVIIFQCGAA